MEQEIFQHPLLVPARARVVIFMIYLFRNSVSISSEISTLHDPVPDAGISETPRILPIKIVHAVNKNELASIASKLDLKFRFCFNSQGQRNTV